MDQESRSTRFFKLYNAVQVRLYSYVLTVVHHRFDADEVLQETAATLWEKFDQFEEGTSFRAWAIATARNHALSYMRKKQKARMVFDERFYEEIAQHCEHASDNFPERVHALEGCLGRLREEHKKLLALRYVKEVSIQRISQLTGRSTTGLYKSFSYIINALRSCMQRQLSRTSD